MARGQVIAAPGGYTPGLVLKILRTIKHLCMGEAQHLDELQRAKADSRSDTRQVARALQFSHHI